MRFEKEMAGFGPKQFVSDTASHTPATLSTFSTIEVLTDANFHTLTAANSGELDVTGQSASAKLASATSGDNITVPAGRILRGPFSAFQLNSGAVMAIEADL